MSKLTIQAANAARDAAAAANTRANEAIDALRRRVVEDCELADTLSSLLGAIYHAVNAARDAAAAANTRANEAIDAPRRRVVEDGDLASPVSARFRDRLEPTARSYGFTLTDHPTRKDLVLITPLEN